MRQYPPPSDDVLEAFRLWYNAQRNCEYRLDHRPDEIERTREAIDVVLVADGSQLAIAVEVSSIWRSEKAGKEDAYCGTWFEEVRAGVQGRIKGVFRIGVPMRIRRGVTARTFADAISNLVTRRASEIPEVGRCVVYTLEGMKASVSMASSEGCDILFSRFYEKPDEFPDEVARILRARGPKLKDHKEAGQETWLVLYNTYWIAMANNEVRQAIEDSLGIDYNYIDHVAVVDGNVPDDAWVDQIR